jgi:hypothetical protein
MPQRASVGRGQDKIQAYRAIIEKVFFSKFKRGDREVEFERDEIVRAANALGIPSAKNVGDVVYSFRFRAQLPESISSVAPKGMEWVLRLAGRAKYRFGLVPEGLANIRPRLSLAETKVPDATPGIISMYALTAEQSLLAKLRYNRLVDIFAGVACYSLQSHLQTQIESMGQVETDELYLGIDRHGAHYVLPIQAKGGNDLLSVVQIEQDFALCQAKFPALICRPIAAQFMGRDLIALFDFEQEQRGVVIRSERHYRLVAPDEIQQDDLEAYRRSLDGQASKRR